jgi:glycosyltransferase involved in cell wall biosynthesis
MRVAQIAPLYESVPPKLYGGTERVVSYLTEELTRLGHEVTLFASGDSETSARLVPCHEKSLRLDTRCPDSLAFHVLMIEEALKRQDEFDVIHSHINYLGFAMGRRAIPPVLSTIHGRMDLREHKFIFAEYAESALVSISNAQRMPIQWANWAATVYHGIPPGLYSCRPEPADYLVYVGRISPEKRVDSAISIAAGAGIPLKIAAKVDAADRQYYENYFKKLLDHPLVEFLGEVTDRDKNELVGGALAFLHPVDWPEPFGLTLIESMACGTPVIARRRGSIPEVVDHGVTGFVFERDEEAIAFLRNGLSAFSRTGCRERFEKRFQVERMARDYLRIYDAAMEGEFERVDGRRSGGGLYVAGEENERCPNSAG